MPVWLIPMIYSVTSLLGAVLLPRLEHALMPGLDLGVSPSAALAILSGISSGMMALTGIVFSVAFVMLQFSAISYSPRFAARFARDPILYHALGIFFATFTYALAATAWTDRDGSAKVLALSALLAVGLLFVSMIVFALLMRRLGDLQVTETLRYIGDRGREVIRASLAASAAGTQAAAGHGTDAPVTQVLRHDGPPRYVERYDVPALVALARRAGGAIEMDCAVGDMVLDGTLMLQVRGSGAPLPEAELRRAVRLGADRTFEQDPKYPLRLLVDVAIKALSPAINDPTTAVQALDQIEDLLRRLARHPLAAGIATDGEGVPRLRFPVPSWSDYLALAFDEIRVFGATSVQVLRRMRAALAGLEEVLGTDPRAAEVRRYMRHMDATIARSAFDEEDRDAARREDPQGLGLTR